MPGSEIEDDADLIIRILQEKQLPLIKMLHALFAPHQLDLTWQDD